MSIINSIENLPNEFFYEIFDYLDGYDIYYTFSNLNTRFHQLINSSSLLLKLNFASSKSKQPFLNDYQQIFLSNKQQILSIHFWISTSIYQLIPSFTLDSSFHCLESLVFYSLEPDVLLLLLPKLSSLPRLFSLTIDSSAHQKDFGDIYQFIFKLSKLRYFKFTEPEYDESDLTISLPMATNEQMSTIEYLSVNHPCAYNELYSIISYTPQLRRLKYLNLTNSQININIIQPKTFSNLTRLSIQSYEMSFDELEIFINKLNSKLKILSLTTIVEDIAYLDADRWESFIIQNLPQLEKFYFKYSAHFAASYATPMYVGKQNQFNSPFWLERRWILEIEIECENLIYSIHPYKKRWYDYGTQYNSSDQLLKSTQLDLDDGCPERWTKSIFINTFINHAVAVTQIYQLEAHGEIDISKLNEVLRLLPEVNSLKLHSLSLSQTEDVTEEEIQFCSFLSSKNQLTKLYLGSMTKMEELFMLQFICSRINHLQINCVNYMHAELLTGLILTQINNIANHSLRLLCFCVPEAHNDMIEQLQDMIIVNNLPGNFMVKHEQNKLYLQWK